MANTFRLDILSPDETVYSGECECLTLTLPDGEAAIMRGHAPMLAMLPAGKLRLRLGAEKTVFSTQEAFLKVSSAGVEIFSQGCEEEK